MSDKERYDEELKKKAIKLVHKKNDSKRYIEQTNGSDDAV